MANEKEAPQIEKSRHSLAHLLAMAVLEKFPQAKLGIGPIIENGFYYDFDFKDSALSDKDLSVLEKRIKKLAKENIQFEKEIISEEKALEIFKDQPFKLELVKELAEAGEKISIYKSGDFVDLCAGPHVENSSEINGEGFKLTRVAGAYWKGSENNPMLTRIYGLAFATSEELEAYLKMMEEAEKRDHKKLGKELKLFVFSDLVGSGLPLWTPKGTIIRELLNDYVWDLRKNKGYDKVAIPHITKKDLYEISGHWAKFSDELFKIQTREGHLFAMKPMNCPHHTQIFDAEPRSYKEMPHRYCETTMVYRDEQSGELAGLSRVRSITQDDAHVFCRENQVEEEMFVVWDIIDEFYKSFGFELEVRFSRHDPDQFEKYIGTKETWEKAEKEIKKIIDKRGVKNYIDGKGEAAMYGPKIDFIAKDSIGRTLQVATIQLDFNMPERFNLNCINEKGEKERIVMIHCAIMGSIERFMSTLIEHFAGAFPVWLSPIQAVVLNVGLDHQEYAEQIVKELKENGVRAELVSDDSLGKRIRASKLQKIPYIVVIGDKEIQNKTVNVDHYKEGQIGEMGASDFIEKIKIEIKERK